MANPYDRIIKTPAEKRADDFRKSLEPKPSPSDTALDFEDIVQMEFQEGPVGVGTSGYIMPGETAGTIPQEDGSGFRVPYESFEKALTPLQKEQYLQPYPAPRPEPQADYLDFIPDEPEAPWYADLPHVPYVSPAAATVRDKAWDAIQFTDEMPATVLGGLREAAGAIAGQEGEDFYGKWFAGGIFGEEGTQEWMETHGFPLTAKLFAKTDPKMGFSNTVIEDILKQDPADPDAMRSLGDVYHRVIETHRARPGREQFFLGMVSPTAVLPVGGVISKLYRGLKLSGKVAVGLVKNADDINKAIDPQSVYYRVIDESLQAGERQIIIVSRDAPEGRRITVRPSGLAVVEPPTPGVLPLLEPSGREWQAGYSESVKRALNLGDTLQAVSKDAKIGDIMRPYKGGKQYQLVSKDPIHFEAVPYPGPQPGVSNAQRLEDFAAGGPTAYPTTGAQAFKNRLRLEVSKGLDPTAAADATEFIDSLPANLLDELISSFRNVIDEATAARMPGIAPGMSVAGFYDASRTMMTIMQNVVNRSAEPSRTIIHELFHHIEQFIPNEQIVLLRNQWIDDMADNGDRVIQSAENILKQGTGRLTDAERIAIKKAYRYEGGFPEWIAEVMTDKAMRDILQEIPEYRNLLQRIFDQLEAIAIGTMNFLLRKGRTDEAEKIYQNILKNKFSERIRYFNVTDWDIKAGRPKYDALLDVEPSFAKAGPRMAWETADEGIDVVTEALGKQGDEFQILPGNASRAEVLEAAAKLGPPKEPSAFGPGLYAEGPHRAFIPSNQILRDEPAFAYSGITQAERASAIERFWEWLPKELPGLGDLNLPTDAFKVTRFVKPGAVVPGIKSVADEDITKIGGLTLDRWVRTQRANLRSIASLIEKKWKTDAAGLRKQAWKHFGVRLPSDQAGALSRLEQRLNLPDEDLARQHLSHMRKPGIQTKAGYGVGPVVRKVNAPSLAPDIFGDKELLHIVDGDDPYGAVVAAIEIEKVGGKSGAKVLAFYPVAEGTGPGMFGREGMQQIIRQIGDIYPNLDNMDFAGKLAREGNTQAEQFIGTAAQSMAQRLSDTNIGDDIADSLSASFPRASSVDAARAGEAGVSAYGYTPKPTIEGYTHTLAQRINEARGMAALEPWERAVLAERIWPIKPGELLFDMADYGHYNFLFDKPGLANKIAARIPGSARLIGVWNRAQLELDDPVRFIGHEVTLHKEVDGARAHYAVMAWRNAAYPDLGMKEVRSLGDFAMNNRGIWRAQKVVGYDSDLVKNSPMHGTIDDILKDADEVKKGIRTPDGVGGKKKQVYFLNEKQQAHINMGMEMMEQSLRRNQQIGVNVQALAENYWHRMLIGGPAGHKSQDTFEQIFDDIWKKIADQPIPVGRSKETYMLERVFDDLDDAAKKGFTWETDPAMRLLARLNAGIDSYAHQKAWDKVLQLKTAEGKPFLTRAEREAGKLKTGKGKQWFTEGPDTKKSLKLVRETRVEARKLYKADPNPATELLLRRADADFITAYRKYRARHAMANPNFNEFILNGRINDRSLVDEIFENIDIPQVQRARLSAGKQAPLTGTGVRIGAEVAQVSRALLTNADLAGMFINGQTLLYRNTAAWFTAVFESTKALVRDPWVYVGKNRPFFDEGTELGHIIRPTEYMFTQTGIASIPTRLPLFGPAFRAFQRAFEWFIIVGQTEMFKATRTKVFKGRVRPNEFIPLESDDAREALIDLGKAIRKELGTESHAILGIRPTQRTLESITAFAARFMRANIGLISLALRPTRGADSLEAKRALMQMMAGVTSMTAGIHIVQTGRPPNFTDPYAADWFQFPIGKTYYNLMGPLYSYFRTIARISDAMIEGDEVKALKEAKNFLEGRAGIPIRAMGITAHMMATGKYRTFEGEEVSGISDAPTLLAEFAEPISVGGVMEAIEEGRYEAVAAEVFGLQGRATPNAQMDILFQQAINDPQNELYRRRVEMGLTERGKTWYDADPKERKFMEEEFSTIAEDIVQASRGPYGEASREWEKQDAIYIQQQIDLALRLHKPVSPEDLAAGLPPVDGIEYRARLQDIQKNRWVEHDKTIRDYELFQEEPEADDRFEQAMFDYHKVFELSKGPGGTILWGIFDELMEKYEDDHPPEELEYVLSVSGLNNDTTATQLRNDKRALREVWDWQEELLKEVRPDMLVAYEQYRNMSVTAQRMVNPAIKQVQKFISYRTSHWLETRDKEGDPQAGYLEQKLVYWGYETAPVTQKGIETLEGIIDDMGYDQNPKALELRDPRRTRQDLYPALSQEEPPAPSAAEPMTEDAQWLQRLRSAR